ncbi:molybdenum cofactor biosynthesis protein MoaE [Serinicoccus sp. LYQ131]|uniref:molybdenum cofactor biosynthesis protein MoaE n=1 Tax=Serinicoccus sp. LYQ131 TaxID=3378797 RepID=UPI003852A5D8
MSQHQSIVVDVRDLPLSVDEALREVRHPRAGAVSLFVGTVREHDEGREGVTRLDYSAHPGAVDRVRALVDEVAGRPQVHGVYAVHRVGTLEVGDLAVVCAVAAEHRAEAFDGCRHLIEELKSTVPIWKRQQFEAGEHEWVGL